MSAITIRIPDEQYERIKLLARSLGVSVNKLYEQFSVSALSEFDAYNRFAIRSARGSGERGLELLNKVDDAFNY